MDNCPASSVELMRRKRRMGMNLKGEY
jgi:hypothetical protein